MVYSPGSKPVSTAHCPALRLILPSAGIVCTVPPSTLYWPTTTVLSLVTVNSNRVSASGVPVPVTFLLMVREPVLPAGSPMNTF